LINILPLPAFWLGLFAIGSASAWLPTALGQLLLVVASIAFLYLATSPAACVFYTGLGSATAALALLIARQRRPAARSLLAAAALSALVAFLIAFLTAPDFFAVFFPYMPSLSYLVFRGIALLTTAASGQPVPTAAAFLQMLFLPTVVLGPITRLEHYLTRVQFSARLVLIRLCRGLAFLLAATLAGRLVLRPFVVSQRTPSATEAWLSVVANSFELYFLFAGYSDLVIGLGHLAGFSLPDNFRRPYLADSVTEFWRRWHISLSYFIRDYVYIPLGGGRCGLVRKNVNLLVAMTLCGLWHGLTAGFLVWGLFHGTLLVLENTLRHHGIAPLSVLPPAVRTSARVLLTFILVSIGWIPFTYDWQTSVALLRIACGLG